MSLVLKSLLSSGGVLHEAGAAFLFEALQ